MRHLRTRRAGPGLGILISLVALLVSTVPAAAVSELAGHHGGEAYGTRANAVAGDIAVKLGRTAYQVCPCLGTDGEMISNTIDTVQAGDAGNVFRAAVAESIAQADKQSDGTAYTKLIAEIADVNALDGAVTADLIRAKALVGATENGFTTSSKGSRILGLRVLGQLVDVSAGARVDVPGFGYIELKDVEQGGDGAVRRTLTVEMLRIVITKDNSLDIPVGTRIIVAHAQAVYSRLEPVGLVTGSAFAADASSTLATVENRVGRAAAIYMGCISSDAFRTNNVEQVDAPGVLATGTGVTTLSAKVDAARAKVKGTSSVQSADLLDGFLTADLIKGVSRTERLANGSRSASYQGSRFVNLRVAGIAIGDEVQPNTTIGVPGVGELVLYETVTKTTPDEIGAGVTMVHLTVDTANTFGLPVGTEVRIGFARTKVQTP